MSLNYFNLKRIVTESSIEVKDVCTDSNMHNNNNKMTLKLFVKFIIDNQLTIEH